MKNRVISAIIAGTMILSAVPALSGCSQSTSVASISDTLSVAERYLSEMKYEQAIIEFDKVLNIDPNNVDAYIGKAEAYIAMGDTANAIKTLQTGYDKTGDERIKAKLDELSGAGTAESTSVSEEEAPATEVSTETSEEETTVTEEPSYTRGNYTLNSDGTITVAGKTFSTDTEVLDLSHTEISKLDFLQYMSNLKMLNLSHNSAVDLSCLEYVPDLGVLILDNAGFYSDESFLAISKLEKLELLFLKNKNMDLDFRKLARQSKLPSSLKVLIIENCSLTDEATSVLSELTELRYVDLSQNYLSDVSCLSNCVSLQKCDLSGQRGDHYFNDLSPLADLPELEDLYITIAGWNAENDLKLARPDIRLDSIGDCSEYFEEVASDLSIDPALLSIFYM